MGYLEGEDTHIHTRTDTHKAKRSDIIEGLGEAIWAMKHAAVDISSIYTTLNSWIFFENAAIKTRKELNLIISH